MCRWPGGRFSGKSLYSRKGFSFYQDLCRIAHEQNCRICAQLHQSDSNIKGMLKYIPGVLTKRISADELRVLLNEQVSALINGMPEWKVREITSSFGPAAALAREAGFDVIQVHGDRMAGSFSSELFNQRRDCYGGKPENRARFAAEAVAAVKKAVPDMPIDYKLAVRRENPDYGKAGVLADELPVFIPILEAAGVTSFHVTLADHSRLTDTIPPAAHPDFGGEGCFLEFCDLVRGLTGLPVTGVGGLTDPDFVEAQLASGRIDCAALCRQLIADPDWPVKLKNGRRKRYIAVSGAIANAWAASRRTGASIVYMTENRRTTGKGRKEGTGNHEIRDYLQQQNRKYPSPGGVSGKRGLKKEGLRQRGNVFTLAGRERTRRRPPGKQMCFSWDSGRIREPAMRKPGRFFAAFMVRRYFSLERPVLAKAGNIFHGSSPA